MRDLGKVLTLFEREFVMDYCEEFTQVKAILEYMHTNVKPFNRLHFRSGNEPFITEIVRRMQEIFLEFQLIDPETKKPLESSYPMQKKILLFLVASTDATYKYNLRDNSLIAHVLELCPLMPKFLLCSLVWELQMDRVFFEMLAYAPCWFTFQFVEAAVESLKYVKDAFDVLEKVGHLLKAILISVTQSRLLDLDRVDSKCILTKLYDSAINLLRQFYTPDSEKFNSFRKDKLHRYQGYALKHILQLVLFAMDVYEDPATAGPNKLDISIYEILQMPEARRAGEAKHEQLFKEHQRMILTTLLNSLQYNIMLVKLDMFLSWVEEKVSDSPNLQQNIGEMAHMVGVRMAANPDFQHDVSAQISAIAIKPKTLEESLADATIGEILLNLEKPLEDSLKSRWLGELFKRKLAFGNDECLSTIKENIPLMCYDYCLKILEFMKLELDRLEEDTDLDEAVGDEFFALIEIMLASLPNLTKDELVELLTYQRTHFQGTLELFCLRRENFPWRVNTFLNKYAQHFVLEQFLHICFELQDYVWDKLFENACLDQAHLDNFSQTIENTMPYSAYYVQPMITAALQDEEKLLEKQFPELLCRVFFALYHPDSVTVFLKEVINKRVSALLEAKKFELLLPIVKALNLIDSCRDTQSYKPLNFGDGTAPALMMAAHIMEKARWDLITYTNAKDELVIECVQFIQNVSKKFLPVATEKDRKWLTKNTAEKYRPLTKFYFQKYALQPHEPQVEFDAFLMKNETAEKTDAQVFLIVNFVRCTMKETEWLARNENLLAHISDVMILLSKIVIDSDDDNAINSYRNCLTNYANIVMKFLLPQALNDSGRIEKMLMKIFKIINSSPESIYNEIFMNFESLLLDVVNQSTSVLKEDAVKSIRSYVAGMRECQAQRIFLEKLVALVTESMN